MGWSNRVIALNCAMDMAQDKGLRLAIGDAEFFTTDDFPDLETNLKHFVGYEGRSERLLINRLPSQICNFSLTWTDAFYRMRRADGTWTGCSICPLSPALLEQGLRALEELRLSHFPSLHLRGLDGQCEMRYRNRNFVCSRPIPTRAALDSPCEYSLARLARSHAGADFLVYSDGQDPLKAAQFAHVDSHDFFTQYAMMALAPLHVGNVLSTVDLLVAAWRHQLHGPGTTAPFACYQ